MERTIDRTSYRRSARYIEKEVPVKSSNTFSIINMFFNQVIVSLLIIIMVFAIDYYDIEVVKNWVSNNFEKGYTISEVFNFIIKKDDKGNLMELLNDSGDKNISGDNEALTSGECFISGENDISGETQELITAVEGINQMADDAKAIKQKYNLLLPVNGTITSNFGCRVSNNSVVSSYHAGLDIGANSGTDILSAHDGKVILAKVFSSYGNCIMIENGELITLYAHCSSINVKEGQEVKKGDVIGRVGMTGNATGPHLHLELRYDGRFVDPKLIYEELK